MTDAAPEAPASSERGTSGRASRARRPASALWILGIGATFGVAFLTSLGIWQLHRLAWKLDLIARVEQRVHATPAALPVRAAWPRIDADHDAYRRVTVRGQLLHDRETLTQAVTDEGPGYWVMTPLRTDGGDIILINRGFVPPERRDPHTRAEGNPSGEVQVTGLLRITEPKGGFLRHNDPADNRWYSRDVAAIAETRNLGAVAPFFIDADGTRNPGGYPIGGLTVVAFHNNHLVYAITWFSMALLLAGAAIHVGRHEWTSRKNGLDKEEDQVRRSAGTPQRAH